MGPGLREDGRARNGLATLTFRLYRWTTALADLLFPLACFGCGEMLDKKGKTGLPLCLSCETTLIVLGPPLCQKCGLPLSNGLPCPDCNRINLNFDECRGVFSYAGEARSLVLSLKHARSFELAKPMGLLMAATAARTWNDCYDVVAAVPTTTRRLLSRGYNQAALLALQVAKTLRKPFAARMLKRVEDHGQTQGLSAKERADLVRGCFEVTRRESLKDKRVLLVDDVMTTGATASACAGALKTAGAAWVGVVVFARTVPGL